MTQYVINIGTLPNDGTGDPLRTAFNETNLNFNQVFAAGPVLSNIRIANNTILTTNTNGNLVLAPNGIGVVQSNVSIVPNTSNIRSLGTGTQRWSSLYVQYANVSGNLDLSGILSVGDLSVTGNLTVTGNTIQVGNIVTETLTIQLANAASTGNAANGAGITVGANDNIATMLYSSTGNTWTTNIGISSVGNISAPYFVGNGSQLTGITSYTNANVVTLLANFGSNSISTTGNITATNIFGNIAAADGNTSVQINRAGILGAAAGFSYDYTGNVLYAPGAAFSGQTDGTNGLNVGYPVYTSLGSAVMAQFTGNVSDYSQVNFQNISNTATASGDYIITADNGNDTTHFLDLGMTSSAWNGTQTNSLGNLIAPNTGYLYVQDGNLALGTKSGNTARVWTFGTDGTVNVPLAPSGQSNQIKYGTGNLVVWNDGGWTIGEYNGTDYGTEGIRINPGIEGSADIVLPADPANVPVQVNNYSGNVRIQTGEGFNWTFDGDGEINIPTGSNSFGTGRIQSANGYPTLLGYGSGDEHGGPELDWMNSDDLGNAFGNSSVLRNTMYINDNGLYIGINENNVANVASPSWRFAPDGNLVLPGSGNITNQANTSLDPATPTASTMVLTPDENYSYQALVLDPTAPGHIHLRSPSGAGNIDQPAANIFLGGELSSFEVGASYGDAPNVFVHSNGNTWTFGGNGTLTLAGDITAKPVGFPFTSTITNITTGGPTVVVDIADNVFGAPVTGKVLIQGVVGTTEANETWYYQAVEANQFQLFNDAACTIPVDGTSWTAYVNGGTAYASAYDSMAINTGGLQVVAGPSSWYFGMDGNINIPGDLTIGPAPGGGGSIVQPDGPLQVVGEGANAFLVTGWTESTTAPGNVAVIGFNAPFANGISNITVTTGNNAGSQYNWAFTNVGETVFPILGTARGDTTGGTISGYTLRIGDGQQEAVITTPDGTAITQNSQRLVINPGKGADLTSGEGGDIYLWAGRGGSGDQANAVSGGSGGDIKIRGGQGGGINGAGGYIRMEAGDGSTDGGPGFIEITSGTAGGNSATAGGYVRILGGQGPSGGDANITGGVGTAGPGGPVNITGGTSGNGLSDYGNVNITSGASTWTFNNTGTLIVPGEGVVRSINNTIVLQSYDSANSIGRGLRIGDNGGVYLEQGSDPTWLTISPFNSNAEITGGSGTGGGAGKNITITAGAADLTDYYTTPGGNLNLQGGTGAGNDGGGGGPGGSVNITSGFSNDPAGRYGNVTVNTGISTTWNFDYTGNLTVPGSIVTASGTGGNISGANVITANIFSASGNITGANLIATANVLGNGYASFAGTFDESIGANTGVVLGYAGGTPRILFGTGNTQQTFEIDNDSGNLRFYQPGSTKATLTSSGNFSAAGNVTGGNLIAGANVSVTGRVVVGNGSPTVPSFSFTSDGAVDTGFYWVSDGNIGVTNNGIQTAQFLPNGVFRQIPQTVGSLPSAATVGAGARAFCTDLNSTTFGNLAVGGGGTYMPVFSNGTNWYIG